MGGPGSGRKKGSGISYSSSSKSRFGKSGVAPKAKSKRKLTDVDIAARKYARQMARKG